MAAEGGFPKVDGDILYASEANRFNNSIWNDLIYTTGSIKGVLNHSATTWSATNGTSTIRTTNSGVTWAAASADNADMTGVAKVCVADKTKSVCFDHNTLSCFKAADSGDTWSASSTSPAGSGRILDCSFPTATVAVCCGDSSMTTRSIYYSTNAGDTWTVCAAGPTGTTSGIDMLDGTTGFAVQGAAIWKTTNGGVNWVVESETMTSLHEDGSIIATSATTFVALSGTEVIIQTVDTAADAVTVRMSFVHSSTESFVSNLLKTTNGNIYFTIYKFDTYGSSVTPRMGMTMTLYRSTDSGVTWQNRSIGDNSFNAITALSTNITKAQLVEYDTNKLLFVVGDSELAKIDETG